MPINLDDYELVEEEGDYELVEQPKATLPAAPIEPGVFQPGWKPYQDEVPEAAPTERGVFGADFAPYPEVADPYGQKQAAEDARLEAFRKEAGVAEIPTGLKAATALSSGFTKAGHLPAKTLASLQDITGLARVLDAVDFIGPEGGWQSNTEAVLRQIAEKERRMAISDEAVHGNTVPYQILEGSARGAAELPYQMLPAAGARNVEQALKIASGTAGFLGGTQQYAQDRGEGRSVAEAAPRAILSGIITAMTTRAFGATGAESILRSQGIGGIKARLKDVFIQAGHEIPEEMIDQMGQDILERHDNNPGKRLEDSINEVLIAGAVGGIVGGSASAVRNAMPSAGRPRNSEIDQPQDLSGVRLDQPAREPAKVAEEFHQLQQMEKDNKLDAESAQRLQQLRNVSESGLSAQDVDYLEQERVGMGLESSYTIGDNPDDPFTGQVMRANTITGKVEVNPFELAMQMQGMSPDQRKAYIKAALSEEQIHLATPRETADKFISSATGIEKFLAGWRYTGNISGKPQVGNLSKRQLGHEMLRSQIQRMRGITRTELAATVKSGQLTTKILLATEDAIFDIRKALGTKASKEQLAALDQVEKNVKEGLKIAAGMEAGSDDPAVMTRAAEKRIAKLREERVARIEAEERAERLNTISGPDMDARISELNAKSQEGVLSDADQDELRFLRVERDKRADQDFSATLRIPGNAVPEVNTFIQAIINPEGRIASRSDDPGVATAVKTGLALKSVDDLNALLSLNNKMRSRLKALRAKRSSGESLTADESKEMFNLMGRVQFPREAVEAATSTGGWIEGTPGNNYGPRPLDVNENPGARKWMAEHGAEMGIEMEDAPATLRLYRGSDDSTAGGTFWTSDPKYAARFGGNIQEVTLSREEAAAARKRAQGKGNGTPNVYEITPDQAKKAKPSEPIEQEVYDLAATLRRLPDPPKITTTEVHDNPKSAVQKLQDYFFKATTPDAPQTQIGLKPMFEAFNEAYDKIHSVVIERIRQDYPGQVVEETDENGARRTVIGPGVPSDDANVSAMQWLERMAESVDDYFLSRPPGDDEQSFPAAIRRGGPSKRGQEIAEQMRRIAEMRAKAKGEELPPELQSKTGPASGSVDAPVAPEDREAPETFGFITPTPADVTRNAQEVLSGDISVKPMAARKPKPAPAKPLTPEQAAEAAAKERFPSPKFNRPTFQAFVDSFTGKGMRAVAPAKLREAWEDSVWSSLMNASGARLESWRRALGMENNYGTAAVVDPTTAAQDDQDRPKYRSERMATAQEAGEATIDWRKLAATRMTETAKRASAKRRYRLTLIDALANRLIEESHDGRPDISRNTVTVDDVDFGNELITFSPYTNIQRSDLTNIKRLYAILRDGARGSSSDPESASRRLVAVADAQGQAYLLSTYNDAGVQRVVSPLGTGMRHRPHQVLDAAFLKQFRPFASILLTDPIQGFKQQFKSVSEFNDQFGREASDRARIGDWEIVPEGPAPGDFEVDTPDSGQGGAGIEGEGGSFMGPAKDIVAQVQGGRAMETAAKLTDNEASAMLDHIQDEVGIFDSPGDVENALVALADEAERGELSNHSRVVINGYRKIYDAIAARNSELTPEQVMDRMVSEIYENFETSQTAAAFVKKSLAQFAPEGPRTVGPPAKTAPVRDLTQMRDVAPTTVRGLQGPAMPPEVAGRLRGAPPVNPAESDAERAAREKFIQERSQAVGYTRPLSEMSKEEWSKQAEREAQAAGGKQLAELRSKEGAFKVRNRIIRKYGARPTIEQAQQIFDQNFPEEGQFPATLRRRAGPTITNLIRDFGSSYDSWMVDRIERHGSPLAIEAAEAFRKIIDRQKKLYGELTPNLDPAKRAAGGNRMPVPAPARASPLQRTLAFLSKIDPIRVSPRHLKGMKWLNEPQPYPEAKFVAATRVVGAMEGTLRGVPIEASEVITPAQVSNLEIGRLFMRVVPSFKAGGLFQRNINAAAYEVIRTGPRPKPEGKEPEAPGLWEKWTAGLARINKLPIAGVREFFMEWKGMLDTPGIDATSIERFNQDFSRRFPKVVTHIRHNGHWQPVVHSDLFGYLESSAQRASHAVAFREVFPFNPAGQEKLKELVKGLNRGLPANYQKDLQAFIASLQGHPTDDYSGREFFGSTQVGGTSLRLFNQTIGNLMARLALSGQLFVQPGEVIAGATPAFLGYKAYLRGLAQIKQLYPEMERAGMVNRVIYDFAYDSKSPVRSAFKISSNAISKIFVEQAFNELQEAGAAAAARITAQDITSGNLTDWQKRMLPQTFKAMGFNQDEVMGLMQGDPDLLGQFERKASAFLTSGNKAIAEGSRLGANRLFNSIFRFHSYPMMKLNQFRRVLMAASEAWLEGGNAWEKRTSTEQLARFLFGTAAQGVLTVGITSLFFSGIKGLELKLEEAKDDPMEFLTEAFLATLSGPMYIIWRGLNAKGILGVGESVTRTAFPYTITTDLIDFGQQAGKYRDLSTFDRIGKFASSKIPGTKAIRTVLSWVGLSQNDQYLDASIDAFKRWRRDYEGFKEVRDFSDTDVRADFRVEIKKAVEALKDGKADEFYEAWQKASEVLLTLENGGSMTEAFTRSKILKKVNGAKLTDEDVEALRARIGDDAYQRLEYFDLMLEEAAKGVILPKFDE